jgi:hypothetical protein
MTWNIAYKMTLTSSRYYKSKFYCSVLDSDATRCVEEEEVYKKRLTNILTQVNEMMDDTGLLKDMNYVFLQECTSTLLDVVTKVARFDTDFRILHKGLDKNESEFCLVVRKSALPTDDDILFFDFNKNMGDSPMSKYISSQFYSYDIEVNTGDLKRVMCYIVKSRSTIFFNVHFAFGKTLIFKRQTELYNFMNAIVYSIRSIPQSKTELYPYQNYDIVFTGDFNLNMLQRFPQDIKRFGYPDNNNMIPIFFTCNYIPGQRTIISTTPNNKSSARATNGPDSNYNLTNIDFSIIYPRIGDNGTKPIKVTILNGGIPKRIMPAGSVGSGTPVAPAPFSSSSSTSSTPATTLKVMSFNTWYEAFNPAGGTKYCNVTKDVKNTNVCQQNIIGEILKKMEEGEGYQVIFLQEFTSRIQEVFKNGFPVDFSDTGNSSVNDDTSISASNIKPPFTMTYTPSGGSPLEYFVYTFRAGPEFITIPSGKKIQMRSEVATTLCSKSFFDNKPADKYFMGNLVSIPNDPLYASEGQTIPYNEWTKGNWLIGGSRPYIVLVFDDRKIILINIHAPHGYDASGHEIKFREQTHHNKTQKDTIGKVNKDPETSNLMKYAVKELGNLLRNRIPNELKNYSVIIGGDFNTRPDRAQNYLVMLGKDFFSNDSKTFYTTADNLLKDPKRDVNTCCITSPGNSFSSPFDQIYSNKLNIKNYDTYDETKLERTQDKQSVYFSDHLPVYAEIEIPASGPSAPASSSSGGSKRFTLRNNDNNNKPISRKIRKSASISTSMPTTKFTKKQHSNNKKHKTRRHKH